MRQLVLVLAVLSVGCDKLLKKETVTPKQAEQNQREGTDEAAQAFAKDFVRRKVNDPEANFGWGVDAKRTATEVDVIWWEISGKVKFKNKSGEKVTEKFSLTATKPLNSNHWKWIMCTIGKESYMNEAAGG